MLTDTMVQQDTYAKYPDGTAGYIRLNRRGELVSPDPHIQMILDGRVFIASNIAMETAKDIGDATYAETEPAIAIDVPTGTTFIPLDIMIYQGGAVASADVTMLMTVDTKTRITSGTAITARNYLINATEPNSSAVTVKIHSEGGTDLLTSAPSIDATFFAKLQAEALVGGDLQDVHWSAKKFIPPVIKGPGSLCIYWYGTGNPEGFWHVIWVEIPTINAT